MTEQEPSETEREPQHTGESAQELLAFLTAATIASTFARAFIPTGDLIKGWPPAVTILNICTLFSITVRYYFGNVYFLKTRLGQINGKFSNWKASVDIFVSITQALLATIGSFYVNDTHGLYYVLGILFVIEVFWYAFYFWMDLNDKNRSNDLKKRFWFQLLGILEMVGLFFAASMAQSASHGKVLAFSIIACFLMTAHFFADVFSNREAYFS